MIKFMILCVVISLADLALFATVFDSRQSTLGYISRAIITFSLYSWAYKLTVKEPDE